MTDSRQAAVGSSDEKRRDAAAFESLYRDHHGWLFTLAFRVTGDREEAEDALQSAFLSAYRAWPDFRGESSPRTWLYRILLNEASRRAKRRMRTLPMQDFAARAGLSEEEAFAYVNRFGRSEDQALSAMVRESCLQMFMNCLPSRLRAVYALRSILGFSARETSAVMGMTENAVGVCLHRARRHIEDHFQDRCSLVSPDGPCDCRAFASYQLARGLRPLPVSLELAMSKEAEAAADFQRELRAVVEIDRLYRGRFERGDAEDFVARLRRARDEEGLRILGA